MRRLLFAYLPVLLLLFLAGDDTLQLTPVERLSAQYHFNLVGWEVTHFPDKWLRELNELVFPFIVEEDESVELVQEYFRLGEEENRLSAQLDQVASTGEGDRPGLQQRLREVQRRRDSLRSKVERVLEAEISTALREEGIPFSVGGLIFPPIDFALVRPPSVLVVSPRDRIHLSQRILLAPDIPVEEREALEERILQEENLSALVAGIGGLSTYPSILNPGNLRHALTTAVHEWLHQYLFFHPLGQSYNRGGEMSTLNETAANLFGKELGNRIYTRLTAEVVPTLEEDSSIQCRAPQFCSDQEMRRTRLRVEELLAQGNILEAEAYMEKRRQLFVENGYYIRKLNQAYFAHHGKYADSPASISPIHGQLRELRQLSGSLAEFINIISGVSSYNEFIARLRQLRDERNQRELSSPT